MDAANSRLEETETVKRYLIALALALGMFVSVTHAQTGATTRTPCTMKASIHLDYTDFRDRRRTCRAQAHNALERRCRSHQRAHFTTWAQDVLKVDRHRNLYGWFALRRRVRAASSACLSSTAAIIRYVFPNATEDAAISVAYCESRLSATAYNPSGAAGLFQLMPIWYAGKFDPFDALANARAAYGLSSAGYNWTPWVCQP